MSCVTTTKSVPTVVANLTQTLSTACKYCGEFEVTFSPVIENASCSECGAWQFDDEVLS